MRRVLWLVVVLAGCKDDGAAASDPAPAKPRPLAGVYPDKWKCDSVATLDALGQVLGGAARPIESPMSVPRGVPHPCNYELAVTGAPEPEYWTFDVDCRDGMKSRADALFAQYRETSRALIEQYEAAAAADAAAHKHGGSPHAGSPHAGSAHDGSPHAGSQRDGSPHAGSGDAGVDAHPPSPAIDVDVGAKGLDHHGQGLLFIDDDAPCYVRVVGKDAARRLELARMLAKNLTFANAPMSPRAAP